MIGALTRPLALLLLVFPGVAHGQTDLQRAENLATCLSGRFPSLCRTEWLSTADRQKAALAERQENLKTCLSGKYPILCDRNQLSIEEKKEVAAAEERENLNTCLTGRYKVLCNKQLLSESELPRVLEAERAENLRTCLTGRFPSLCDHSLLTPTQDEQVRTSERQASQLAQEGRTSSRSTVSRRSGSSRCESGHWVESVSDDGEIVKSEDGSIWEVDATDTVDSTLWLPTTEIVVCDGRLINTDDNEKVSATRLR
jgi:hypothetical protein